MRRALVIAGVVFASLTAGAVVGGYLATADDELEQEPTDDDLEQADRDDRDDHRPANVTVGAHEAPVGGSGECVVTARIEQMNDDDRIAIEPVPTGDVLNPISYAHVTTTTRADTGDDVRVYSFALEGNVTMHFEGTVTDDCSLEKADDSTEKEAMDT